MKLNFGAAVILYNPTKEQLNNLLLYQKIFQFLFIFDNSDVKGYKKNNFTKYNNIEYISENENRGLPYAFNKILKCDKCRKLDYLCILDQDSIFKEAEIINLIKKIKNTKNINNYGIISPLINYGDNNYKRSEEIIYKKWVITSGSFLNLYNLYKSNIKFDENYFIDKCDVDLCKQFIEKGYKIGMYRNSVLCQKLGDNNLKRHSNHSITRHYYIFRNRLYFNNKWYGFIKKIILNFLQTAKHIILILIYEKEKFKKIKMLKRAIRDYKNKKMGKIIN